MGLPLPALHDREKRSKDPLSALFKTATKHPSRYVLPKWTDVKAALIPHHLVPRGPDMIAPRDPDSAVERGGRSASEIDCHPGRRSMRGRSGPAIVTLNAVAPKPCIVVFGAAISVGVAMSILNLPDLD